VHGVRAKRRERLNAPQGPPSAAPPEIDWDEIVLGEVSDDPDEIEALAGSATVMTRMSVAGNQSTPPHVLVALTKDEEVEVRRQVALSAAAPVEALAAMVKDRSWRVRLCVALNPRTPQETLVALTQDRNDEIRWGLAERDGVPPDVLDVLGRDYRGSVRRKVAANSSASDALVSRLMEYDSDYLVKGTAREAVAARIEARLGVRADNTDAINALLVDAWWDMTPESPEVVLAIALSPNA